MVFFFFKSVCFKIGMKKEDRICMQWITKGRIGEIGNGKSREDRKRAKEERHLGHKS